MRVIDWLDPGRICWRRLRREGGASRGRSRQRVKTQEWETRCGGGHIIGGAFPLPLPLHGTCLSLCLMKCLRAVHVDDVCLLCTSP